MKYKIGDRLKQTMEGNCKSKIGQIVEIDRQYRPPYTRENRYHMIGETDRSYFTEEYLEKNFVIINSSMNQTKVYVVSSLGMSIISGTHPRSVYLSRKEAEFAAYKSSDCLIITEVVVKKEELAGKEYQKFIEEQKKKLQDKRAKLVSAMSEASDAIDGIDEDIKNIN